MPCSSLLDTQPPESGDSAILPLTALSERFELSFAEFGILWVFARIGQRHEDHPSPNALERASVDTRQTPEKISAACPRETPYSVSNTSTTTPRRTPVVPVCGVLEGESGYRPSY